MHFAVCQLRQPRDEVVTGGKHLPCHHPPTHHILILDSEILSFTSPPLQHQAARSGPPPRPPGPGTSRPRPCPPARGSPSESSSPNHTMNSCPVTINSTLTPVLASSPWALSLSAMGANLRQSCRLSIPCYHHLKAPCSTPRSCSTSRHRGPLVVTMHHVV